jgi:hypothetical protein
MISYSSKVVRLKAELLPVSATHILHFYEAAFQQTQ